ncbi:MAG: hypothetical protein CMM84_06270 [Rhodothermaceae bacterium]|nr:hypothetical protein [Rhodothermaceae bacterium]MBC15087.1 hypothetical protein [Rhodothermaceae bacterium]
MSFPLSSARGRTRVSAAVLDATTTIAAGDVQGVLSVESLTGGAMLGGALGGTLGLAQGGPLGAAVGASAGAAVGAAAGHALRDRQRRQAFVDVDGADGPAAPDLHVAVTARYGEDLLTLADRVRAEVEAALLDVLGLRPGRVTVEVVDVVSPEAELAPHPSS